ncbi:hypothetical protein ACF07Y_39065 [Streptomyces sp. NPDC016566]|uniref:hypothetical protein n=1 Tax=Streptomyces sp. NPDC016566 TaxID=3364967 RepID=UPI003702D276
MKSKDIFRTQVASFVPISPGVIETVPSKDSLLGATVTASPASVALDEGGSVFAVDGASVAPELQKDGIPTVPDTPFCLTLRIDLAIMSGSLLLVTYQVTALWPDEITIKSTNPLSGDLVPSGEQSKP